MGIMSNGEGRARFFTSLNQPRGIAPANRALSHLDGPRQSTHRFGSKIPGPSKPQVKPKAHSSQIEQPSTDTSKQLPIVAFKRQILQAIGSHNVTILTAPTGTGKSTNLPMFLLEAGYEKIIVTNPRRTPCVQLAKWVAQLDESPVGTRIAYRHGRRSEVSPDSQVIFTTEGYQLERELKGLEPGKTVYILDESHEFTANWDVLLLTLKKRLERGDDIKVIIATATLNGDALAKYLSSPSKPVAVIDIPVKHHPIKDLQAPLGGALAPSICDRSITFLWGKGHIANVTEDLEARKDAPRPLAFHAELSHHEQQATLDHFATQGGAILTTNCLQTSVTLPDVARVVSSGWIRRERIGIDGERHLVIEKISQHEATQQRGRTGRTGPGEYLYKGETPLHLLPKEPPAEMESKPLTSLVLKAHRAGRNFERLNSELFHPAPVEHIREALKTNQMLNLLGPSECVTPTAEIAVDLPIEPNSMKILADAQRISGLFNLTPEELLIPAIDLVSVLEVQGIVTRGPSVPLDDDFEDMGTTISPGRWKKFLSRETQSDPLAQMQLLQTLLRVNPDNFGNWGVHVNHFREAVELRAQLIERLARKLEIPLDPAQQAPSMLSDATMFHLNECLCSGMINHLYRYVGRDPSDNRRRLYKPVLGDGELRQISRESVVRDNALFVVGTPITIDVEPYDPDPLRLITMAHGVSWKWLKTKSQTGDLIKEVKDPIKDALHKVRGMLDTKREDDEAPQKYFRPHPNRPPRYPRR